MNSDFLWEEEFNMALLPKNIEDIRESFELHIPHPRLKPEEVIELGKKEYLILKKSTATGRPWGVPLRFNRGSTYAYRYYYRGKMFDIRAVFRRYLMTKTPRPKIPTIPHGVNPIAIARHGEHDISCLERCLVEGNLINALEIRSVGQAFYVFGCMENGKDIDEVDFKYFEGIGEHLSNVLADLENNRVEQSKQSTTENTSVGGNGQKSITEKVKLPNVKTSAMSLVIPPPIGVMFQQSSTEHTRHGQQSITESPLAIMKEIRDRVIGIESKLELLDERVGNSESKLLSLGVTDSVLIRVEDIAKEVLEQVVGKLVNEFETGIRLNKDGESFLLMMLDRIDELINGGMSKKAAFEKVHEEMNIEGSEFHRLQIVFCNCKLGINKGKPVTVYDIERYWRKEYYIAECRNQKTGEIERRVLRKYN